MIHREFVPEGNIVNSESYLEVLEKLLLKQNLQTKLYFQKKGRRLLIHNNSTSSFCHNKEVPSGKTIYFIYSCTSQLLLFPTVKTALI